MSATKCVEIVNEIGAEIRNGEHGAPGTAFMTVRELCDVFDISLVTAQRIVTRLKEDGLLVRSGKRISIAARPVRETAVSRRIGVVVTKIDNPFFSRLLNALELSGRRRSLELISAGSDYSVSHERHLFEMLENSGAGGFLVCPAHDVDSAPALRSLKLPFTLIGRRVAEVDADTVMTNDFEAGRLAATHLIEQRCTDFLYMGVSNFRNDMRFRGFAFELHQRGVPFPEERHLRVNVDRDESDLPASLARLHSGGKTGVFCYHDLFALRMIRAARLCKFAIPREVSVVGFDDLPIASEVYPSLTSISYPLAGIAENALEMLLRRLHGSNDGPGAVNYLDPALVVRESSFDLP
ncbi:MAG: substrate-binding domain-containing protein [Lentisphaeria bacterium]|nr:substrate-binding domain-containing protein [Lentisphaeria bacterium]